MLWTLNPVILIFQVLGIFWVIPLRVFRHILDRNHFFDSSKCVWGGSTMRRQKWAWSKGLINLLEFLSWTTDLNSSPKVHYIFLFLCMFKSFRRLKKNSPQITEYHFFWSLPPMPVTTCYHSIPPPPTPVSWCRSSKQADSLPCTFPQGNCLRFRIPPLLTRLHRICNCCPVPHRRGKLLLQTRPPCNSKLLQLVWWSGPGRPHQTIMSNWNSRPNGQSDTKPQGEDFNQGLNFYKIQIKIQLLRSYSATWIMPEKISS